MGSVAGLCYGRCQTRGEAHERCSATQATQGFPPVFNRHLVRCHRHPARHHLGLWRTRRISSPRSPAWVTYALGSLLLFIAAITAGLGLVRSGGLRGATSRPLVWLALLAGLAVTANNGFVMSQARGAPAIHDISTDTETPPAFVAIVALRRAEACKSQRVCRPGHRGRAAPRLPRHPAAAGRQAGRRGICQRQGGRRRQGLGTRGCQRGRRPHRGHRRNRLGTFQGRRRDPRPARRLPAPASTCAPSHASGRGDMGVNARRVRNYLQRPAGPPRRLSARARHHGHGGSLSPGAGHRR
jgi:hypothetical protein